MLIKFDVIVKGKFCLFLSLSETYWTGPDFNEMTITSTLLSTRPNYQYKYNYIVLKHSMTITNMINLLITITKAYKSYEYVCMMTFPISYIFSGFMPKLDVLYFIKPDSSHKIWCLMLKFSFGWCVRLCPNNMFSFCDSLRQ